jgi:hypothetical protein
MGDLPFKWVMLSVRPLTPNATVVKSCPMFTSPVFCIFESKSKRKPSSATPVVGFGLVLVKQGISKDLL